MGRLCKLERSSHELQLRRWGLVADISACSIGNEEPLTCNHAIPDIGCSLSHLQEAVNCLRKSVKVGIPWSVSVSCGQYNFKAAIMRSCPREV